MSAERLASSIPPDPHKWVLEDGHLMLRETCIMRMPLYFCQTCGEVSLINPKMTSPFGWKPCL